jgi:anti-sigma B factor antagonist
MPPVDSLTIERKTIPNGAVLVLCGSASMEVCDEFNTALVEACSTQPPLLVLDLSRLEFICSLGLGAIVAAYVRARKDGGDVVLVSPCPSVREVLDITRLGSLLRVCENIEDATR